jgi:hypothetical protein
MMVMPVADLVAMMAAAKANAGVQRADVGADAAGRGHRADTHQDRDTRG